MSPHDTLQDRLAGAAGAVRPSVPEGAVVRRRAVQHRNRRRLLAGSGLVVAVAAVAVAGSTLLSPRTTSIGPATPSPTVTTAPTESPSPEPSSTATTDPTTTTPPVSTTPAGPPPLIRPQAQAVVQDLRFPAEAGWVTSPESSVHEDADPRWLALACPGLPIGGGPLAVRFVSFEEVDFNEQRQVVVFENGDKAATAFADLRSQMRACHAEPRTETISQETWTTAMVGSQLALGDESFWVAEDLRITSSDDPERLGQEQIYTSAALLVLDDNVVTSIFSPAWKDEGRSTFVREASAEWEQFRPAYEELRRP